MDVVALLRTRVAAVLREMAERGLLPGDLDLARLAVEPCRDAGRGDLAVNAAMAFGAAWRGGGDGQGTARLAEALAGRIAGDDDFARVSVAGAGFLNVTLAPRRLAAAASAVLAGDPVTLLGRPGAAVEVSVGLPVAPRCGSPDPSSLADARAVVVADALGRLLAGTGHAVSARRVAGSPEAGDALRWFGVATPPAGDDVPPAAAIPAPRSIEVRPRGGGRSRPGPTGGVPGAVVVPVAPLRLAPGRDGPGWDADLDGSDRDALRFAVLCRERMASLDLDPAAATDRSHAAPLFDVLYAHARGAGTLRAAAAAAPDRVPSRAALARVDLAGLAGGPERDLLRSVALFPHAVERAVAEHEPQRLAALLRDLASAVHRQWNRSKDQPQLRFVNEEQRDLTKARLGLMMASTVVLKSGLGLFGITAPDEMR